ncbi:ArsR/SmtB family transcription factor [Streptomyces sp. NRRL F-5135]|uniref:ArsR/SmtB family transcription factor n=1 Tax=Streptomyces sp. NRRL F-5135 TaxID=1463858 RepID=UPI000559E687|nr:DUF5937 family protein [Streptomyces sp. NRRL F-5135]
MGLRIRFSPADLGRVTVAERPDPLWEVLLAAHVLQTHDGPLVFGVWRRAARARLDAPMRRLLAVTPARGYSPDFLTPAESAEGVEAGLEAVRRVPRTRLRRELDALPPERRELPWLRALAEGRARPLCDLADAIAAFRLALLAPYWPAVERHLAADRSQRATVVLRGGVDQLLATLHPSVQWRSPVLCLNHGSFDRDLHLDGRGLLLLPSFFCWEHPTVLRDPDLSPVLVYPVTHDPRWAVPPAEGARREVAALIGRTRAAVLEATADGRCTTELARRVRTSPASASEHLKVLRETGLITTRRDGTAALHALSPLGRALLEGVPSEPPRPSARPPLRPA